MHPNIPSFHLHHFLHDKNKGEGQVGSRTASRGKLERNFIEWDVYQQLKKRVSMSLQI